MPVLATRKKKASEPKTTKKGGKTASSKKKETKKSLVWVDIVKTKQGNIKIKNLDDLPREMKKLISFYHGKKANKTNLVGLEKALKAGGMTHDKKKGYDPAELEHNRKKKMPKFEARTFEFDGDEFVELGYNYKPRPGTYYVVLIETGKRKKKIEEQLWALTFIGVNCVHFVNLYTEDCILGVPEMLEERKFWGTDEDGERIDDVEYELIPVKLPKNKDEEEPEEEYDDEEEFDEDDEE